MLQRATGALGLAAACAVLAAAPGLARAASPGDGWWAHIAYLASDAMQGRQVGSKEYDKAAAYVAREFKRYGLKPAGAKGYMQPVRFTEQTVKPDQSSVTLFDGTSTTPIVLGEDMNLLRGSPQPAKVEAPLVFIGYGLHLPQLGYDDFAHQDLKGKIVVVINGGPASLSAAAKSSARASQTWKSIERAGALGLITLQVPKGMDVPWARQTLISTQSGMYLAEPGLQEADGPRFSANTNPANSEKLFARSGHSFAEVLALADAGKPIQGFDLKVSLRASIKTETRTVTSANILGVLPGSDPLLSKDYVVVSAHLDHLGVGAAINGDTIYNGAMDDASGVASVLEVAQDVTSRKLKPKRSILFAVFTAEEKGLLGSRAFAEKPTVPKDRLVADINMDMFLPLWELKRVMIQGTDESSLGRSARAVAAASGYEVTADPYPERNSFTRTDQYSFVRAGIPALSVKFGFALGSPEQQMERDWRTNRYHSPSDDLKQPVNLDAAAKFNRFIEDLALHIADEDAQPTWNPGSIFAPAAPRAEVLLTVPIEMPVGNRPQRHLPGFG